jgi:hypothetical protein
MYIPKNAAKGDALPTVVFVTGGAWTIGYKAWGALLGRRLCDAGVLTMCLDYRNFPQVTTAGWTLLLCVVMLELSTSTDGVLHVTDMKRGSATPTVLTIL